MSEPQKHTVQTEFGPTTVEAYECDSCGNTVAYENTVQFTIGNRDGRACNHCENEGPINFPERQIKRVWDIDEPWDTTLRFDFLFPYIAVLAFLHSDAYGDENRDYFAKGFMRATFIWFLWAIVAGVVWWLP